MSKISFLQSVIGFWLSSVIATHQFRRAASRPAMHTTSLASSNQPSGSPCTAGSGWHAGGAVGAAAPADDE